MATAKRFSYSMLISTLAFAVFAVFAFSGLFPWIEAQFYSPKVVGDLQARLDDAALSQEAWQKSSVEKLGKLLSDPSFEGVLSPTASQDALQKRFQSTKLFLMGLRGGGTLRILNADRTQVHFSSEDSDVKVRGDFSITYRPVAELTDLPSLAKTELGDGKAHILADPSKKLVYFLVPWADSKATQDGAALLGVSLEDMRLFLVEAGLGWAEHVVPLAAEEYLFSLVGQQLDPVVVARVQEIRGQGILPPVQKLGRANGQLTTGLIHKGRLNLIVPASTLELNEGLKWLLLASFFTVVFLVTFLLMNLRGEPLSVVTRKVKRFQLQVVKQYLDLKETDKIQSLRDELAKHSDEIRSDVRRSLGRVKRRDQEWVDRYIDTSWQEVMDLLRGPSPPAESASNADWKRLETLLQQALTQGRFVVSGAPATAPPQARSPKAKPAPVDPEDVEELEEIGEAESADEVEELEDVTDAEALEDLEEVESLDDAEELDEVQDAEEVEELEDLEEVEELEAAETEDADELEEVEELEGVEPEAEDAEEVETLEEVEDLEELDDAVESTEEGRLEELPRTEAPDFSKLRRAPAPGATVTVLHSTAEEGMEVEEVEDLEEVLEEFEEEIVGVDVSIPLERLDAAWTAPLAGVFEESDDVVSLSDEVFEGASPSVDAFGSLVSDVLAGPDGTAFEPLEEDLVPRHVSRDWRWTGAGFDWDRFALGDDEVNLFRALSEIVTQFDAFTAAILTESNGVWKAQSSVGFSDSGKDMLSYPADSAFSRSFLSIRALHVLKGGLSHEVMRSSFHTKDMKFLKSVLCVPLLFRHEPAWLLLGLRHEPGDLIDLLAPRHVV